MSRSKNDNRPPTKPLRVNFLENQTDFAVLVLGSLGFSYNHIKRRTRLTPCQISYRLRKGEANVTGYRNGESPVAHAVMDHSWKLASSLAHKKLRKDELKKKGTIFPNKLARLLA
jgi:hypothetical protein